MSNNVDITVFTDISTDSSIHSENSSPLHIMKPAYPYGDEHEDGENSAAQNMPLLVTNNILL